MSVGRQRLITILAALALVAAAWLVDGLYVLVLVAAALALPMVAIGVLVMYFVLRWRTWNHGWNLALFVPVVLVLMVLVLPPFDEARARRLRAACTPKVLASLESMRDLSGIYPPRGVVARMVPDGIRYTPDGPYYEFVIQERLGGIFGHAGWILTSKNKTWTYFYD